MGGFSRISRKLVVLKGLSHGHGSHFGYLVADLTAQSSHQPTHTITQPTLSDQRRYGAEVTFLTESEWGDELELLIDDLCEYWLEAL